MTNKPYMVVCPDGDRSTLAIAYVPADKTDKWHFALHDRFETREDAEGCARHLAKTHSLKLDKDIPCFLDDAPAPDGEMRLYSWPSLALAGSREGTIIALGLTPNDARTRARKEFLKSSLATQAAQEMFEVDLQQQPEVLSTGVIFAGGVD